MTKKRILNVTSTKKRDTMVPYSNVTASAPNGSATYTVGPATLTGANNYVFGWVATARQEASSTGNTSTIVQESSRTATTCYMRGLSENIQVVTNSGLAWEWRRICFKFRGSDIIRDTSGNFQWAQLTSQGYVRTVSQFNAPVGTLQSALFKGTQGQDWTNFMNAPIDTRRVELAYDKKCYIESGNASGLIRTFKRWHPMNKNLVYNDDESGGDELSAAFSVQDKRGMGDYYVIDIIFPNPSGTVSDVMTFSPNSTLYWHEK